MNRRRFLCAIAATPIAAALAPLMLSRKDEGVIARVVAVQEEFNYQVARRLENLRLSVTRGVLTANGIRIPEDDLAKMVPYNWYWLEVEAPR